MSQRRLRKTTKRQYEVMLNFLKKHPIMVSVKPKQSEAQEIAKLWQEFAAEVTLVGDGFQKSPKQWHGVFREWKTNTRRKIRKIAANLKDSNDDYLPQKELNDLEKQLMYLVSEFNMGTEDGISTNNIKTASCCSDHDCSVQGTPSTSGKISLQVANSPTGVGTNSSLIGNVSPYSPSPARYEVIYLESIPEKDAENEPLRTHTEVSSDNLPPAKNDLIKERRIAHKSVNNKCTSAILRTASQLNCDSKRSNLESSKMKKEGFSAMGSALSSLAEVCKAQVEVDRESVKIQKAKLKLEYYKVFGKTDGFEEFLG